MDKPANTSPLRDYQRTGVQFLCSRARTVLADYPGLGKTLQALGALSHTRKVPVLIFAPRTALGVWRNEILKWLGEEVAARTVLYRGTVSQRIKLQAQLHDVLFVITTYKMANEIANLYTTHVYTKKWGTIICDEYHMVGLRNHRCATYKIIQRLLQTHNSYFYALSGTPSSRGPHDYFGVLHLCDPKNADFKSYYRFVDKYCIKIANSFGYDEILKRPADPVAFHRMLAPYVLSRRKEDVLSQLPPKIRQIIPIEMSARQKVLYNKFLTDMLVEWDNGQITSALLPITRIMRLRQLLVSPRCLCAEEGDVGTGIIALMEMLQNDFEAGNNALIFTPFRAGVVTIIDALHAEFPDCAVFEIHGNLPARILPADVAEQFQTCRAPKKVIVATVQTGASWTATDASSVYFLGYEWDATVNMQAEDRAHRIGQKKTTHCKYFKYENTIDEDVLRINVEKNFGNIAALHPQLFFERIRRLLYNGCL